MLNYKLKKVYCQNQLWATQNVMMIFPTLIISLMIKFYLIFRCVVEFPSKCVHAPSFTNIFYDDFVNIKKKRCYDDFSHFNHVN